MEIFMIYIKKIEDLNILVANNDSAIIDNDFIVSDEVKLYMNLNEINRLDYLFQKDIDYTYSMILDFSNNIIISKKFIRTNNKGQIESFRDNDLPSIIKFCKNGEIERLTWEFENIHYRQNHLKPTSINYQKKYISFLYSNSNKEKVWISFISFSKEKSKIVDCCFNIYGKSVYFKDLILDYPKLEFATLEDINDMSKNIITKDLLEIIKIQHY